MTPSSSALHRLIQDCTAQVGIIGLGYVGLPLAVTTAAKGYRVIGFDVDPAKMAMLDRGENYIEAVSAGVLASVSANGRFQWTTDFHKLAECQVIIICVPTPLTRQREPDLSFVRKTAESIARNMRPGTLVVLESTTYPGTTAEVLTPILETSGLKHGTDFFTAFSPEREDPGNATYRTANIPKVVAGDGPEAGQLVAAFYERVVDRVVQVANTRTAEAVKITENIFRAVNIALVNELKQIYDAMGIDVWDVIDAAATKPFGYMPFYPGPGLGGHCIPIDPFYLTWKAREFDISTRFIELAGEVNMKMPDYVISKLRKAIDRQSGKGLKGSRILLVGMSYKKNVSDMRESPSAKIMETLLSEGANVDFMDPHVPVIPPMREHPGLKGRTALPPSSLPGYSCDAVLISTDHDAIDYGAFLKLNVPVIDARNAMARRGLHSELIVKA